MSLSFRPGARACATWAETQAAYRFFDHELVTPENILRPHRDATVRCMREESPPSATKHRPELCVKHRSASGSMMG